MKGQPARAVVPTATFSPRFPKTIVPVAGYPAKNRSACKAQPDRGELTPG
jgi:hypothetical protein